MNKKFTRIIDVLAPKYARYQHCCVIESSTEAKEPGGDSHSIITPVTNWVPRAAGWMYNVSEEGVDLKSITHGTIWEVYIQGETDPVLVPVDKHKKFSHTSGKDVIEYFQKRISNDLCGTINPNTFTGFRQADLGCLNHYDVANAVFCFKHFGRIQVCEYVCRKIPSFPKIILYLGIDRIFDFETTSPIHAKDFNIFDSFSSDKQQVKENSSEARLTVDPANFQVSEEDSKERTRDIIDQVFKTYGKDAYSAIYMVINTILCLAHWYSREEGESRYKLAFLNLVGLAGSGKTRSCILSSRMLGIRNNNGHFSNMTNSTTEAGLWDIAKNFKDIPIILNDPKPGGKDRQDQLRILYDGGRDHTLAHGSRGHGINLVCASNNKYFNLIITEEPDRERILLVPFSSKVTTKMMADLVAKENTASECTSALIRAANYLSQEGHAWMEENIETVGAQFPSLHPRICVTLAAYHAGRTALLKTVGSEGVLSNDGEYDAFVRRLVDLNSAISDSSPNSSQELFPVVQISTTFAWMLDLCKQAAAGGVGSMEDLKANMKFVATRSKETELAIRMPFLVKHKMKETFDASKRLGFSLKTVYFNGERVFSYVINFSSLKSQHEELAAAIEKIWNFNKRSRLGTSQDSDSFTSSEEAAGRVLPASAPATLETTVTEGE